MPLTDAMCTELYRLKLVGIHICIIPLIYIQVQGTMEWIATEGKVGFYITFRGIQCYYFYVIIMNNFR